ncbi:hypothetical protein HY772_05200 [Candidatus Woesearchaeota archaeon]|nr:hypothetical protein [Candidatus Woesearchaeota archaeon]
MRYICLDTPETVDALNAVYDVLTPYLNHFVASTPHRIQTTHWSKVEHHS